MATKIDMRKIQEIVVKLSYFGFTRTCGEVVVSECHVIPSPVNLIGCPVKCVGTANLVVKLSVTQKNSKEGISDSKVSVQSIFMHYNQLANSI